MPWGNPGDHRDFEPQRHDDGYIEVIGFTMASLVRKVDFGPKEKSFKTTVAINDYRIPELAITELANTAFFPCMKRALNCSSENDSKQDRLTFFQHATTHLCL